MCSGAQRINASEKQKPRSSFFAFLALFYVMLAFSLRKSILLSSTLKYGFGKATKNIRIRINPNCIHFLNRDRVMFTCCFLFAFVKYSY